MTKGKVFVLYSFIVFGHLFILRVTQRLCQQRQENTSIINIDKISSLYKHFVNLTLKLSSAAKTQSAMFILDLYVLQSIRNTFLVFRCLVSGLEALPPFMQQKLTGCLSSGKHVSNIRALFFLHSMENLCLLPVLLQSTVSVCPPTIFHSSA